MTRRPTGSIRHGQPQTAIKALALGGCESVFSTGKPRLASRLRVEIRCAEPFLAVAVNALQLLVQENVMPRAWPATSAQTSRMLAGDLVKLMVCLSHCLWDKYAAPPVV